MTTTNNTTIGVVGAGRVASYRHLPILEAINGVEPAFIADVAGDRAARLASVYGCTAIDLGTHPGSSPDLGSLPSCDVALLALPLGVREPYINEFAERSTPVLSEKPFAPDVETHRRYTDTHEVIACNYMRQWFSSFNQARVFLESKPFGELERVKLRETGKIGALGLAPGHYQTDPDSPGGGILLERGCHPLSQLTALFPDDELNVERATIRRTEGIDVDTTAMLRLETADIPVEVRFSAIERVGSVMELEFEKATVSFDPATGDDLRVSVRDTTHEFEIEVDERWAKTTNEAMYLRWEAFLEVVHGEQPLDVPAATGMAVSRLLDTIRARGQKSGVVT